MTQKHCEECQKEAKESKKAKSQWKGVAMVFILTTIVFIAIAAFALFLSEDSNRIAKKATTNVEELETACKEKILGMSESCDTQMNFLVDVCNQKIQSCNQEIS